LYRIWLETLGAEEIARLWALASQRRWTVVSPVESAEEDDGVFAGRGRRRFPARYPLACVLQRPGPAPESRASSTRWRRVEACGVIDIRAALLDPTDLRGIPSAEDGWFVWCPPSFLPAEGEPAGILFFTEAERGADASAKEPLPETLDRRIGEYRLADG